MSITVTTAPAVEPITLAEAKTHCRVTTTTHDDMLTAAIVAARQHVEARLQRPLITQTRTLRLSAFPATIVLRDGLTQSITSITYVDGNGTTQTLASSGYETDLYSDPPRIAPSHGNVWPATRDQLIAVTVTYVCGYGLAVSVPDAIKSAIKLIVGDLFENREASVVGASYVETQTVSALLAPYVSYAT